MNIEGQEANRGVSNALIRGSDKMLGLSRKERGG
jgi:hypothetical protein